LRSVTVRNGNVEAALRVFKRKVNNSEVLMEYRERQEYIKPSTKRNQRKQAAAVRERKRQANDTGN
jgi:small subunit ribosomal protein S21